MDLGFLRALGVLRGEKSRLTVCSPVEDLDAPAAVTPADQQMARWRVEVFKDPDDEPIDISGEPL